MAEWTEGLGLLVHNKDGVEKVVGSIPNWGNILGEFFILPGYLVRFSLRICPSISNSKFI